MNFGFTDVPAWNPTLIVSDEVTHFSTDHTLPSIPQDLFKTRISSGYRAPAITFADPHGLMVSGHHFITLSSRYGITPESKYLVGDRVPMAVFHPGADGQMHIVFDDGTDVLVAGNSVVTNYYHWTMQVLPAILAFREKTGSQGKLILPPIDNRIQGFLELHDVDLPYLGLPPGDMVLADRGTYTNLTTGDFAFCPHPDVIRLLRAPLEKIVPSRRFAKRIYISRQDSNNRRILNENGIIELMERHGFEILLCSELSHNDQIAAFRDADVIAGPHGAALSNIVYCDVARHRTKVLELASCSFMNFCFLRIAQALGLDYRLLVSPPMHVNAGLTTLNDTESVADLHMIERALQQLDMEPVQ